MSTPHSTYRLQIRPGFDLHAAGELVDYLHDLGADWVYCSPLLTAMPGSEHGYDVVDHSEVDPARGGAAGLRHLAKRAHAAGMGVLVDIVPNHMGIGEPARNAWWWDLLQHGPASRFAEAFDIDWDAAAGRVRLPILGDESVLRLVDGELEVDGVRLPVRAGTDDDEHDPAVVHARQHYELVHWRRADAELNYRRFFAVSSLAGIRVEVPWVFEQSHAAIVQWVRDGLVDGLRVDHPDGLLDPGAYLDSLAAATGSVPVYVEKILEGDERLPGHWRTVGTTGYDALADLDRVLVAPAGLRPFDAVVAPDGWHDLTRRTRLAVADGILRAEVLRIARMLPAAAGADAAIAELTASMPVYRTYLPLGAEHLERAEAEVRRRRPDLADALDAVMPRLRDPGDPAAQRLQQTTGMVMAKGVEDTAFYRDARLASLNEVGGDPAEASIGVEAFHERQLRRQASWPASMTAATTHDTKRGEDVRARIHVLSELPAEWAAALEVLREGAGVANPPFERLVWESVVGAWPASRRRLHDYVVKAAREGGIGTTWADPDEHLEAQLTAMIDRVFDDPRVAEVMHDLVERIAPHGWSNSLSAKAIQLMSPGVPDVYQGSELWETSLVDPDNRREVDFAHRRRVLAELDLGDRPPVDADGAAKLLVASRALRLRRDRPHLFTRYRPLTATGSGARHVIAFDRGGAVCVATRHPVSLARTGWGDTTLLLPGGPFTDLLTGTTVDGGRVEVGALLHRYPVAVLAEADDRGARMSTARP